MKCVLPCGSLRGVIQTIESVRAVQVQSTIATSKYSPPKGSSPPAGLLWHGARSQRHCVPSNSVETQFPGQGKQTPESQHSPPETTTLRSSCRLPAHPASGTVRQSYPERWLLNFLGMHSSSRSFFTVH